NDDGSFGGQYASYSEVSIKRQVARDGQSAYYINNTRCRRRDITDLFLGTGLGPRSYSIIEQGMISRLIEARPEELRVYLEEAAGISKYKERRRETETRIRRARDNLARLDDLVEEIDKQLSHLQRQSKAAERFKELKQEERRLRAELIALRYRALEEAGADREHGLQERTTAMEAVITEQRAIENAMEKARAELAGANDGFNEVQGHYYEVGAEVARIEQASQHARETRDNQQEELQQSQRAWTELEQHIKTDSARLEQLEQGLKVNNPALARLREQQGSSAEARDRAEQAMQEWQQQWDEFNQRSAEVAQNAQVERTRMDHLERELGRLTQRREKVETERKALSPKALEKEIKSMEREVGQREKDTVLRQQDLDKTTAQIAELQEQIERQLVQLDELRTRQQDLGGRLASLEALQQAALGRQEGSVTAWLKSRKLDKAPRLAEKIQVADGWDRAVETVLGFYLEAVCVDGLDKVAKVLGDLEHGAIAVFDTTCKLSNPKGSGAGEPLLNKVRSPWSLVGMMGGVYAADSLPKAMALRGHLKANESVVTRDGIWLSNAWLRVARDPDEKTGTLGRTLEINELNNIVKVESKSVAAAQKDLDATRSNLHKLEGRRLALQAAVNQAHRREAETHAQLSTSASRMEQVCSRGDVLRQEAEEIAAQFKQGREALEASRHQLHSLLASMEEFAAERDARSKRRDALRNALEASRSRAHRDSDTVHELALKMESLNAGLHSMQQSLERMHSQRRHLSQRRDDLQAILANTESPIKAFTAELEETLKTRLEVEGQLTVAREKMEEIEHRLRDQEQKRNECEQNAEAMRAELDQERMVWQEFKVRSDTQLEQLAETGYRLEVLQDEMPADADPDAWEEKAHKINQRIQRLGPINLAAIDEYQEQAERKQYLDSQHADVNEALETLEDAIRKIDKETRTRFKDTFDKVNVGLQKMFPRLFGGGSAYLEMTGDDLLDTGVTVMACPPGKRNTTIHLLSGGEKALTAVALVFSIFELNPSPFCMLDEVDAPLDDANVGRYCDLVREMSQRVQFIFITHNKITMEMAEQLTGVTMSEPGVSRLVAVDVDQAVRMAAG
ncbi:MAG: chromosome segregation protein SMC, partial [Gammaproteobacteria bacterium]